MNPRGKLQSSVGYQLCFGTRGVVRCKSCVVERVQDPGCACNMGGTQMGGEGGKMRYIYSSSCEFLVLLVVLGNEHSIAQPSSCRNTRHLIT